MVFSWLGRAGRNPFEKGSKTSARGRGLPAFSFRNVTVFRRGDNHIQPKHPFGNFRLNVSDSHSVPSDHLTVSTFIFTSQQGRKILLSLFSVLTLGEGIFLTKKHRCLSGTHCSLVLS